MIFDFLAIPLSKVRIVLQHHCLPVRRPTTSTGGVQLLGQADRQVWHTQGLGNVGIEVFTCVRTIVGQNRDKSCGLQVAVKMLKIIYL